MSYTITVFKRGGLGQPPSHIFRTAEHSILHESAARAIATQLRAAYPKELYGVLIDRRDVLVESILED